MVQSLTTLIVRARPVVLTIGLLCVVVLTVPGTPLANLHWAEIVLWICLAYFLLEWVADKIPRVTGPAPRLPFFGFSDIFSALAILPVPIAHLAGAAPASAWLLAVLWLLKLETAAAGAPCCGACSSPKPRRSAAWCSDSSSYCSWRRSPCISPSATRNRRRSARCRKRSNGR